MVRWAAACACFNAATETCAARFIHPVASRKMTSWPAVRQLLTEGGEEGDEEDDDDEWRAVVLVRSIDKPLPENVFGWCSAKRVARKRCIPLIPDDCSRLIDGNKQHTHNLINY